jgi:hypothetical protein
MKRFVSAAMMATLALTGDAMWAQQPATPASQVSAADLPVRRVVLYKSGVGYFEHLGRVRDSQSIAIDFTSDQLDDVLKSLTALDLGGGTVSSVSYNTEASLDRRLGALRLPVGAGTSRAAFLDALRGARLEVRSGSIRVTGRLLAVERTSRAVDGATVSVDALSLVTDTGDLQTFALDPGVSVRVVEEDLNDEVSRYLSLVASERDQDVRRLTISTSGTGDRDLFVSYVSEVPVWKSTYRIVLPADGQAAEPLIQGWAIVDNTVGEDWTNVELSLVAGAPQSFVQSISQPYYVSRPVVPLPERALLAPQTHAGALRTTGTASLAGRATDPTGAAVPGVTVTLAGPALIRPMVEVTTVSGRYAFPIVPAGTYTVTFELTGFRRVRRTDVRVTAGVRAEVNAQLQVGGLEETVEVSGAAPIVDSRRTSTGAVFNRGVDNIPTARDPWSIMNVAGNLEGFNVGGATATDMAATGAAPTYFDFEALQAAASGGDLGDLFEYTITGPVTIPINQSALVPIVAGRVTAEKVSIWRPGVGTPRPLRALWLTNTTGLTLDGGSFTVVENEAFAGEGLVEALKPGERRLLSYALDLGTAVDAAADSPIQRMTRVRMARGLVIQESEQRQRRTYTARNEDTTARELVIEHPAQPGWTLDNTAAPEETSAGFHRFRITVAPKSTSSLTVEETRPIEAQYAISSITDEQVALFVRGAMISDEIEAALRDVLARKTAIANLAASIASREAEIASIGRDQERVRENMRALGGSNEERQLVQRYVRQLDAQETRLETLRVEVATLTTERLQAQQALDQFIAGLSG